MALRRNLRAGQRFNVSPDRYIVSGAVFSQILNYSGPIDSMKLMDLCDPDFIVYERGIPFWKLTTIVELVREYPELIAGEDEIGEDGTITPGYVNPKDPIVAML